jgi:hypothetical protein
MDASGNWVELAQDAVHKVRGVYAQETRLETTGAHLTVAVAFHGFERTPETDERHRKKVTPEIMPHVGKYVAALLKYSQQDRYTFAKWAALHCAKHFKDESFIEISSRIGLILDWPIQFNMGGEQQLVAGKTSVYCMFAQRQNKRWVLWMVDGFLLTKPMKDHPTTVRKCWFMEPGQDDWMEVDFLQILPHTKYFIDQYKAQE